MLYSSGTTGRPKGIKPRLLGIDVDQPGDPFRHVDVEGIRHRSRRRVSVAGTDLSHRTVEVVRRGASTGRNGRLMDRFVPKPMLQAIEQYGVTATQVVPTMFIRLLQLPDEVRTSFDVTSLRLAVHAAAPCPPEVKDADDRLVGTDSGRVLRRDRRTRHHDHHHLRVDIEAGVGGPSRPGRVARVRRRRRGAAPGDIGTIYFEREVAPFEYHNDPTKTAASRHPLHDNWTTVGDVGYLDEDGYLFLTAQGVHDHLRWSQHLPTGGRERPRRTPSGVRRRRHWAYRTKDGRAGPRPSCSLRDDVTPNDDLARELIDYVRDRIAHYKAPRTVDFVDELPRTATGKLAKRNLIDRYVKGRP
jgi:fatty-acyl-CoA synthase